MEKGAGAGDMWRVARWRSRADVNGFCYLIIYVSSFASLKLLMVSVIFFISNIVDDFGHNGY